MSIEFGTVAPAASASSSVPAKPASHSSASAKAAGPQASPPVQPSPRGEALQQVATEINRFLKSNASDLQFVIDPASDRVVVRIVDGQTGEVIRQVPSDEMLAISRSLDRLQGLLLKQKA